MPSTAANYLQNSLRYTNSSLVQKIGQASWREAVGGPRTVARDCDLAWRQKTLPTLGWLLPCPFRQSREAVGDPAAGVLPLPYRAAVRHRTDQKKRIDYLFSVGFFPKSGMCKGAPSVETSDSVRPTTREQKEIYETRRVLPKLRDHRQNGLSG